MRKLRSNFELQENKKSPTNDRMRRKKEGQDGLDMFQDYQ